MASGGRGQEGINSFLRAFDLAGKSVFRFACSGWRLLDCALTTNPFLTNLLTAMAVVFPDEDTP